MAYNDGPIPKIGNITYNNWKKNISMAILSKEKKVFRKMGRREGLSNQTINGE